MAKRVINYCKDCKHAGVEDNYMVFCPFLNHYRPLKGECRVMPGKFEPKGRK